MLSDIITGLLSVIVLMMGAWCKSQENKISELAKANVDLRKDMSDKWLADAKSYVAKEDFHALANELKESLVRIENKIEKIRG